MAITRQTTANRQKLQMKVAGIVERLLKEGVSPVLIVPSFKQVSQYREMLAEKNLSFGLTIATLPSWIEDRWALFGDGRAIVSPFQRKVCSYQALKREASGQENDALARTPGTVSLLASLVEENLALLKKKTCAGEDASFTHAEQELCDAVERYADLLSEKGLCESVQAMDVLASDITWPLPPLVFADVDQLTASEENFLEAMGKRTEIFVVAHEAAYPAKSSTRSPELIDLQASIFDPDPEEPVVPTGAVSFLLPTGPTATARLLVQHILESVKAGDKRIAVATQNPEAMFSKIVPVLFEQGIDCKALARKNFIETDFGRVWMTLLSVVFEERFSAFQMSDIVLSGFSGINTNRAYEMDLSWRNNRLTDKQRCIADSQVQSEHLRQVFALLECSKLDEALESFEQWIKSRHRWGEAYRSEQLSALSTAREFNKAVVECKGDMFELRDILSNSSVPFRAHAKPQTRIIAAVELMGLETLSEEEPCSYDNVFLCDLDAASYPIRNADDAKTRLYEKMDIGHAIDALKESRRVFYEALSVPVRQLVCMRSLNQADASLNYPCVMLEELLDCYRSDLLSTDEINETYTLPKVLVPYAHILGESALYENLAVNKVSQPVLFREEKMPSDFISPDNRSKIVLPHRKGAAEENELVCLSPSAVESYLECPYKWFALRRLRLEGIDAGFGSLEMGSFTHRLLKSFYKHFQNTVAPKVTQENVSQAKEMLETLFDQHISLQESLRRGDNPLIALNALEAEEIVSLKKKLIAYLDREAMFLPRFTPRYFEYDFGDEVLFEYAGCTLHGSIDRIDVNEKGQAVVIDYKGSVSSEYRYRNCSEVMWAQDATDGKAMVLPHKVQTMLYAQAVRKTLDLEVVGAVYLSYGRDGRIAGAYDRCVLDPSELLDIDSEHCAIGGEEQSFIEALDEVEAAVASVSQFMAQGHIAPSPRGKDPCGYCPVTACEKRRGV